MKFLAPMFAASHATKYVNMVSDFLVEWYCKSHAEKVIFAEFIFTHKTKHGSNIFTDRFVEWMMKDLRTWCGNVAYEHTASLLEICALGLKERVEIKAFGAEELKPSRKMKQSEKETEGKLRIDHVFCEVLVFALEANLFGPGPVNHIRKGPGKLFEKGSREMESSAYGDLELTQICSKKNISQQTYLIYS